MNIWRLPPAVVVPLSLLVGLAGCGPQGQVEAGGGNPVVAPVGDPRGEKMVLVFQDEFEGDTLDPAVWKSKEYDEDPVKNDTVRGPGNVEVRDGELLLHVRKGRRERRGSPASWTAAYVYMKEQVHPPVYIESRFKPTTASGVNNAFWLASVTAERKSYRDRYEIDCPETRKDVTAGPDTGRAHLAWHDWKTQSYITDAKGKEGHIAQGTSVKHSWDAYHTWGVWIGEDEIIYYLNGEEVWNGKDHDRLGDQWQTGVGKFDRWFPDEERRAYGKFGQDDWNYNGGFTGDRMNVILATLPWEEEWSPLDDSADGTFMAVDYVRVFKPARQLATRPSQALRMVVDAGQLDVSGPVATVAEGIELGDGASASWPVETPVSAFAEHPVYVSLVVRKSGPGVIKFSLRDDDGAPLAQFGVDDANSLLAGFRSMADTGTASPAVEAADAFFAPEKRYLLVGRLTPARRGGHPAISLSAFPLDAPLPDREPFFYLNIDERGNTAVNNGWHINQKDGRAGPDPATTASIAYEGSGNVLVESFRVGDSFLSVLP